MAASPLFDVSKIDLSGIAIAPEEVAMLNPQCGHMRQLDYVIWMSADAREGLGVKRVQASEFWVPGHIPGRPLLPGVLMIESAAQLCALLQKYAHQADHVQFLGFTRCADVAFRGQVVPGDTLYLLAREISHSRRKFTSLTQALVNGRLVFEATITGMAI